MGRACLGGVNWTKCNFLPDGMEDGMKKKACTGCDNCDDGVTMVYTVPPVVDVLLGGAAVTTKLVPCYGLDREEQE